MSNAEQISQEQFERIERFLSGLMSDTETHEFEAQLKKDKVLANEVRLQRQSMDTVRFAEFKTKMQKYHDLRSSEPSGRNFGWFAAAASVALLLGIGWYFFVMNNSADSEFAQFIVAEPGLPVPMSAVSDYVFYDAMVDYKNENYEKAIQKWETLKMSDSDSDTLNYYIACAFFNKKDYTKAISLLNQVAEMKTSSFYDKSEYYLLAAAILTGDDALIERIHPQPSSPYKSNMDAMKSLYEKENHD